MSDDRDNVPVGGEPDEVGLPESPMRRSDFVTGAAKVGAGLFGLSALGGLDLAFPAGALAKGHASTRDKKIAVIEQIFVPFFTVNFEKPAKAYIKKQPGWSVAFGNENGSVPTGINLLKGYAANNYGILILSTGDSMAAWEQSVKKAVASGAVFINHSTQAVSGATQNVLFSHKQAGVDIGNAAVAWAKKNNISKPVVALLGNLSDAQGRKRTDWAWKTIHAKLPNAKLAGQVQGIDPASGGKAAANLLSAHPDINILITFNTLGGTAALTAATHAGKTDRNAFYLATTDAEDATLKLIASQKSIYQANWGAFFPASMVLMLRDGIAAFNGKKIRPTRLLYGVTMTTPEQANSFAKIAFDPLNPKYAYVFKKYFKYLDTATKTGQVPPGQ